MTKPKYKIGDSVVAKGWVFYGLMEVLGGYWNDEREEWRYVVKDRTGFVRHCREESKIIDIRNLNN